MRIKYNLVYKLDCDLINYYFLYKYINKHPIIKSFYLIVHIA